MVLDFRIDSGHSHIRPIDTVCYGFLSRVGTKLGTVVEHQQVIALSAKGT